MMWSEREVSIVFMTSLEKRQSDVTYPSMFAPSLVLFAGSSMEEEEAEKRRLLKGRCVFHTLSPEWS
ncbi:unnamed protein product [Thlaspi arvense]|uniref:Uncharacterized protein n=1 Tax=Thlaspi arvense TaxID=13288 RepID=A0AAU9SG69_THLAR|nr:unnamed protein product [Thlaspi arvense]